ncbi:hypothetical protein IAE39_003653 [Pseudomonas sp. S37]|uniref:hypothetical protein n=1 Tax=Pseudomonas sp. S37 TaxID=2767449 RepID=UPI00191391BE|nr:hypothetical protein [Pseudomonas sp. S37]MBK4995479.1 hypothetical protein [Pseudomonas sp. S37]
MSFETWPVAMKIMFLVTPFLISIAGVSINLYITLTRDFHVACSSITSNPYIEAVKVAWGTSSLKWRWMLICNIGGLVTFPGLALRYGKLDINELKAFPPKLKRRLGVSVWLSIIGFVWLSVAVAVVELSNA